MSSSKLLKAYIQKGHDPEILHKPSEFHASFSSDRYRNGGGNRGSNGGDNGGGNGGSKPKVVVANRSSIISNNKDQTTMSSSNRKGQVIANLYSNNTTSMSGVDEHTQYDDYDDYWQDDREYTTVNDTNTPFSWMS